MTLAPRSRRALGVAALLALPLLSACDGSKDGGNDEEAARQAAEKAMHAVGNRDVQAYCDLSTTKEGTKPLKDDPEQLRRCTTQMESLKQAPESQVTPFKNATVKKATVTGDRATVKRTDVEGLPSASSATTHASENDDLRLRKIDGAWYIDGSPRSATSTPSAG